MGVAQPDGRVIHFTGQVAWDENEKIVGLGDVEEQTRQCLRNIARVLKGFGGNLSDLVSVTTYYTDQSQLAAIQKIRLEFLNQDRPPASTSVMVAGLGHEDFLVELAPIAVIPVERFVVPDDSTT
jgi:enamine deaminase RidA (YjgF/YER057c/UK114 family)